MSGWQPTAFSSGYEAAQRMGLQRQSAQDAHAQRQRDFFEKLVPQLAEAILEPDQNTRGLAVNSLLRSAEEMQGKPVSKEFRAWIAKDPETAAGVMKDIDPQTLFRIQDNPMLFSAAIMAVSKAKRETAARGLRGEAGGDSTSAPVDSAPSIPGPRAQPQGGGISLGGVRQEQPFAEQPIAQVMGQPQATPAQAAPAVAPAPAGAPQGNPTMAAETERVDLRIAALKRRIDGLGRMGRPETEISPLRTELATLEKERRDLVTEAPRAAAKKNAEEGVVPVPQAELQAAVEAAQRAGRADIAAKLKPGMRRGEYDTLMGQLDKPEAGANPAAAPGGSGITLPGANPSNPQTGGKDGKGKNLIPTVAEEEQRKADMQRRSQKIPDEVARDPGVIRSGVKTQGELEDAIASGKVRLLDIQGRARAQELGIKGANSSIASLDEAKAGGTTARRLNTYLDVLAGAAENAGNRGPWVTPLKQTVQNFANIMGIKDPGSQSNLQLMEAISNKLIPELTKQFKGSQSDREFLAGIASAPNIKQTEKGFAVLVWASRELNKINMEFDLQARKWAAKHGGDLDAMDEQGRTFQEVWDRQYLAFEAQHGTLQQRTARALGMDPKKLLKVK